MVSMHGAEAPYKRNQYGFLHLCLYASQLPHSSINIRKFIKKDLENDYMYKIIYFLNFIFFTKIVERTLKLRWLLFLKRDVPLFGENKSLQLGASYMVQIQT